MKYEMTGKKHRAFDTRRIMEIWGYVNGKMGVSCKNCARLQDGKCFKHVMTELEQNESRTYGFYRKKYVWIKRHKLSGREKVRLKYN